MSAPEQNGEAGSRSSVKLSSTAKGDTQIEVKAYADDTEEQISAARALAERHFDELKTKYRVGLTS